MQEYAEAAGIRADSDFINNPAGTIQWPFAVGVHVGDRWATATAPAVRATTAARTSTRVWAPRSRRSPTAPVVTSTDEGGSLGVVVMIDHVIDGELIASVCAPTWSTTRAASVAEQVEVGDVLGTTGSTGMSTGPHLHFEIRIGGVDGTKVDPLEWLYANTN